MADSYTNYYESSELFQGSLMNVMGTRLDAVLIGHTETISRSIWTDMITEVSRLDKMLNKFDAISELSIINQLASSSPVFVQNELWKILLDCKRYHRITLGYFDITLKDFNEVLLDEANQTVHFQKDDIQLDLSGFAKGYALEKIRILLLSQKTTRALIDFGNSSVLALGTHPHGENWMIGINDPYHPEKTIGTMELKDDAMSTSGNTPQNEKHIINPHTGNYFIKQKVVSIATENAIDAEVLSTALMTSDEKATQAILSNFNIHKIFIYNA